MTFYLLRWPGQSLTAASKLVAVLAFGVLGPLSVQVDGQVVELAGARQRTLLARLLVAGGRVVPVGTIIDDLWGDALPAQPAAAVQAFVSRLRRQLEPDRRPRSTASALVTSHPGYAVRTEAARVDAWLFERLVREAVDTVEDDPAEACRLLDQALALWRGPAHAEFIQFAWAWGGVSP